MDIRNAQWVDGQTINVEVNDPELGWIPFSARNDSGEAFTQGIWDRVAASAAAMPQSEEAARLENARTQAVLSKAGFCLALKRAGILTPDEAEEAARGGWPESFAGALADMPTGIDAADAKIVWAGTSNVYRMDRVLLAVQNHKGLPDEQIDALFGIGVE